MKLKNLLILGAMLVVGSASAEIVDGVRQAPKVPKPNVTAQEIKWGETMYMFNVDAGQFFLGANDWNTRASVGRKGYKVYMDQYIADGATAWDGKQIYWRDSVETQSAIKHVWMADDGGNMWVDNSNEANRLFDLIPQGNNVYRLAPGAGNPSWNSGTYPNVYVGATNAHKLGANTRLYWNISPEKEGAQLDWIFVSPAEYEAALEDYTAAWVVYDSLANVYNVAQALKVKIDEAKSKGIDVAAQEALYLNESSAVEDMEAASEAIDKALYDWGLANATWENPASMTSLITNASYDDNKNDGWSGTAPGFQSFNNAEHYNKTFDSYQDLKDVPAGLYSVKVRGFFRPGSTESAYVDFVNGTNNVVMAYAYTSADSLFSAIPNIYAGSTTEKIGVGTETSAKAADGKSWYVPNNMEAAAAYFADAERGPKYDASVLVAVTDGKLRIGLKHDKTTSGTDWVIWDMWRLEYHGTKPEAYAGAAKALAEAVMNKYDGVEAKMSVGLLDSYKATLSGITASDAATLAAAQNTVDEAVAEVQDNIDGWKEYEALVTKANEVRGDPSYSPSAAMTTMAGYAMRQAPAILKALALTTEELLAEVKKFNDMIETAIRESLKVDSDVTNMFLVNAKFDNKADGKNDGKGWEGKWTDINGPENNPVMEIYGGWDVVDPDWDVYQIVKDAPQGVYEISLNGFFRAGENPDAYAAYEKSLQTGQEVISHASVYVNNNKSALKNVYSEPVKCGELYSAEKVYGPTPWLPVEGDSTGNWYPNGMYDAGVAFAAGMYKSSAHGLVAREGDELRIGVVAKGMILREWVIFDNFQMIYRGKQVKYVKPHLQEAIVAAGENLKKPMDKDTKVIVETAKANAEALLESTDENAVFDALVALYESNDSVEAASAIFDDLTKAAVSIEEAIMANSETATQQAQLNAQNLLTAISEGLNGASLTKAEAKALLAQVEKVLMDLRMPDVTNASDDTPVKFTQLLMTPNFDKDGANSTEGWTGANGGYGNGDEAKALIYEFFNKTFHIYQELKNIPNGTYRIEVSAFNRHGSSVNDYFSYQANPDTSSVYVYGMDCAGDSLTYKQPVARLAKHASLDYFSAYDFDSAYFARVDTLKNVEMGADSIVWVVNSPRGASHEFDDLERYTNTVYVEVTNGTLRLGMEKTEVAKGDTKVAWDGYGMKHGEDWVTMDNWRLYYHGTASKFKPTSVGEVLVAAPGAPVKVEVYNLNGVRLNKPQKGVNIIRTIHADGQVTVKKRLVK